VAEPGVHELSIDEHGRGLALVDRLATRWGVTVHGGVKPFGKSVWFLLTYPDAAPAR
jgi:hypothetical protein